VQFFYYSCNFFSGRAIFFLIECKVEFFSRAKFYFCRAFFFCRANFFLVVQNQNFSRANFFLVVQTEFSVVQLFMSLNNIMWDQ
jgi:hypothetical protein